MDMNMDMPKEKEKAVFSNFTENFCNPLIEKTKKIKVPMFTWKTAIKLKLEEDTVIIASTTTITTTYYQ